MGAITIQLGEDDIERIAQLVAKKLASAPPLPSVLGVPEAAAALGVSERHVRRLIKIGRLKRDKLVDAGSSRVRIARREIERLLAEGRT